MTGVGGSRWWALGALVLCALTLGLDATILNVALPTLATAVRASNSQLQWMADAYILVFAGLLLPAGALGDRYGRKRLLLVGLALFGAASVAAALTHSAGQLIAARAVMGLGAAILTPITMAVLPVLFVEREQARAIAVMTVGLGIGVPLGPLVGGYLLEHFWWGAVFLVNVPVAALAVVAVAVLIPESRDPRARPVDWGGAVLSTVGLVVLVYGIIEAPDRGWSDRLVIGALGAGVVVLAAFVLVQRRGRAPMIDLRLFSSRRFLWGTVAATLASFALFGLLFVLPQYLQVVRGNTSFGTGLRLIPLMAGLILAARVAEKLVTAVGNRIPVAAGMTLLASGLAWGATTSTATGYPTVAGWLTLVGFGMGLGLTPAMHAVLGSLPVAQTGSGSALTMTMRQVGGALGVAVLGSVLAGVYVHGLPAAAPGPARDSVAGAAAVARMLNQPALAQAAGRAYLHAMDVVLLVCAAVTALGAMLAARYLPARPPVADAPAGIELAASRGGTIVE